MNFMLEMLLLPFSIVKVENNSIQCKYKSYRIVHILLKIEITGAPSYSDKVFKLYSYYVICGCPLACKPDWAQDE